MRNDNDSPNKGKQETRYTSCDLLIETPKARDEHATRDSQGDTARMNE